MQDLVIQVNILTTGEELLCMASKGSMPLAPLGLKACPTGDSHRYAATPSEYSQEELTQLVSKEISVHSLGSTTFYWEFL